MINNREAIESLLKFESPEDVYVLMLKQRKKDGDEGYEISDRESGAIRKVVKSLQDYRAMVSELMYIALEKKYTNYRIYITVNPRSVIKAYSHLSSEIFENYGKPRMYELLKGFSSEFKSELHKPLSKSRCNYFVLDLDGRTYADPEITQIKRLTEIVERLPSKNGEHLIVKPFNPNFLSMTGLEIKRDAMTNVYII